ncbi:16S rRNA (cytosine(1402)-N(4))-methyltransferase RsmH [Protofrankia coriariae]|uniref:16S rRNA (cytosine(1402)-N(4))-methyltransferase RsmH n=1 Tax=Protofrankia coriariae TaxID=1562887 RepID=UPI000A4224BC|nr:16S rRNA (cytosine(1402)-N(4))-methyltransferase RsmH [Protofrankia coriariae]
MNRIFPAARFTKPFEEAEVEATHTPVLSDRVVALLAPALLRPEAVLVDATMGLAGHASALLDACPTARLIGLDRDPQALEHSRARLADRADRATLVHAVYDQLPTVLDALGLTEVHGVLFDLGVSSLQLDSDERGFSYSRDAPLDMRMDPGRGRTAADVVNTYDADELTRILRHYGEERFARRIASAVVAERAREPFVSSARLADLVRRTIPAATRRNGGNPAKRTFQALRIEVNGELEALARALPAALDALAVGGRLVVLAYHSLEDRMVKRAFAARVRPDVPPDLPVIPPDAAPTMRWLTRGGETPSADEVAANPRASAAKLRAVERIAPPSRTPGISGAFGTPGPAGPGGAAGGAA